MKVVVPVRVGPDVGGDGGGGGGVDGPRAHDHLRPSRDGAEIPPMVCLTHTPPVTLRYDPMNSRDTVRTRIGPPLPDLEHQYKGPPDPFLADRLTPAATVRLAVCRVD